MDAVAVFALAFAVGACTVLGGLLNGFFRIDRRMLQFMLSASTGILFSVVMLGALPVALGLGGVGYTALGFILGGVVLMITGTLFPHTYLDEKYEDRLYSILKTGSLVLTGILLYNFPAGLLMGSAFASSAGLGAAIALALALQNIPRGVSLNAPFMQAGMERRKGFMFMLFSGVPACIAALLSFVALSGAMPVLVSSGIAFSCGAMAFVFVDQMMPVVKGGRRAHETAIALFVGLFIGVLLLGLA